MSTYAPGTVAVATVRGVKGVRVMRTSGVSGGDDIWLSVQHVGHWRSHTATDVTDVHPLVVLDLGEVRDVLNDLNWAANTTVHTPREERLRNLHDQIEEQTKPPRIDEPGLWGVVEARWASSSERFAFVRTQTDGGHDWQVTEDGSFAAWSELIDPTLIREGVNQ